MAGATWNCCCLSVLCPPLPYNHAPCHFIHSIPTGMNVLWHSPCQGWARSHYCLLPNASSFRSWHSDCCSAWNGRAWWIQGRSSPRRYGESLERKRSTPSMRHRKKRRWLRKTSMTCFAREKRWEKDVWVGWFQWEKDGWLVPMC